MTTETKPAQTGLTLAQLALACDPDSARGKAADQLCSSPWLLPGRGTGASNGRVMVFAEEEVAGARPLTAEAALLAAKYLDTPAERLAGVDMAVVKALSGQRLADEPCPACKGAKVLRCDECDGSGEVDCPCCEQDMECEDCDGSGEAECRDCNGTGVGGPSLRDQRPARLCGLYVDLNLLALVPPSFTGPAAVYRRSGDKPNDASLLLAGGGWRVALMPLDWHGTAPADCPTIPLLEDATDAD